MWESSEQGKGLFIQWNHSQNQPKIHLLNEERFQIFLSSFLQCYHEAVWAPSPHQNLCFPWHQKTVFCTWHKKKTEFVHYNRILHKFPCLYRIITLFWIQYGSIPSFQHIGNKCQETWHNGNISKIANLVNQGSPLQQSSAMQWVKACTTSQYQRSKKWPKSFNSGLMRLIHISPRVIQLRLSIQTYLKMLRSIESSYTKL